MGAETGIEWAHSTVNIWTGCTKVSLACKNCYAETNSPVRAMEVRIGEALQVEPSADGKRRLKMWGTNGFRYETANWERELQALNRKAHFARASHNNRVLTLPAGAPSPFGQYVRPRVFINSLSDIFEDWTGPVYRLEDGDPGVVDRSLDYVRERFFHVAEECTELDILLLTKRPENVLEMVPMYWKKHFRFADPRTGPGGYIVDAKWPPHIWIGTTVEDQEHADKRIPELLKVPAKVRFLSVEPLLGKVDLGRWMRGPCPKCDGTAYNGFGTGYGDVCSCCAGQRYTEANPVDWVIVGGESGSSARPMHPDWVRKVRDQCQAAKVPFFFKQWGEWAPDAPNGHRLENVALWNYKDADEWIYLRDLQPDRRENWDEHQVGDVRVYKVGKKNAGRVLDGELWSEVPGESF